MVHRLALLGMLFLTGWLSAAEPPRKDLTGDPLPEGAVARLGSLRLRPGQPSAGFEVSPDSKTLLTGERGVLRLWDLADGKEVREIPLPGGGQVSGLALSRDGKRYAAITNDNLTSEFSTSEVESSIFVGEVAAEKPALRFQERQPGFRSIALSPDGKLVFAHRGTDWELNDEEPVCCWDVESGKEVRRFPKCVCHALSPEGKTLAQGTRQGSVRLLVVATGQEVVTLEGHGQSVLQVAFSPDGKLLASGGGAIPLDARVALRQDTTVRLWDIDKRKQLSAFADHTRPIDALLFSPDGRTLVSRAKGDRNRELFGWEIPSGKPLAMLPGAKANWRTTFAFSPAGESLALIGEQGLRVVDLRSGTERYHHGDVPSCFKFSPDGKLLIAGTSPFTVMDAATGRVLLKPDGHTVEVEDFLFSPDGRHLASLDRVGKALVLWDTATGQQVPLAPEPTAVPFLRGRFTADGRHFAVIDKKGRVMVWSAANGKGVIQYSTESEATAREWAERFLLGGSTIGRGSGCVEFSGDGMLLATAGEKGTVHIWDTVTGKKLRNLNGHENGKVLVRFSPDGKKVVTEEEDRVLRLWDVDTGKELHQFQLEKGRHINFDFSPDGAALAWTQAGILHVWDLVGQKETTAIKIAERDFYHFGFAGGATLVMSTPEKLYVWDVARKEIARTITGKYERTFANAWLLTPTSDPLLMNMPVDPNNTRYSLRDLTNDREVVRTEKSSGLMAVSADGRLVVVAGEAPTFREVATGSVIRALKKGHRRRVSVMAFSPDGKSLATGGVDGTILLWDCPSITGLKNLNLTPLDERVMADAWADLLNLDAAKAYPAMGRLAAGGEKTVAWLSERMKPASDKDQELLKSLLADLDNDEFSLREVASERLKKFGTDWEASMRRALEGKLSPEVARRLEAHLESEAVKRLSPEALRQLRALQILEQISGPDARTLVNSLAGGKADAWLTREAQSSLRRFSRTARP